MNAYDIRYYNTINDTDIEKVNELVNSMLSNGWMGMPILAAYDDMLITGSHRLAALKVLIEMRDEMILNDEDYSAIDVLLDNDNVAVDVTEIIEEKFAEDADFEIEYDNLSEIFAGTWVEEYADELAEW